jgi:hypothetical protein
MISATGVRAVVHVVPQAAPVITVVMEQGLRVNVPRLSVAEVAEATFLSYGLTEMPNH